MLQFVWKYAVVDGWYLPLISLHSVIAVGTIAEKSGEKNQHVSWLLLSVHNIILYSQYNVSVLYIS